MRIRTKIASLCVALAGAVAVVIWYQHHLRLAKAEFEQMWRMGSLSSGLLFLSGGLRDVLTTTNPPSNFVDLCKAYNNRFPGEWPMASDGNPCPQLLPAGEYWWLGLPDWTACPRSTPIFWIHTGYKEFVDYITLNGEKQVAYSNEFMRLLGPLTNHCVRVVATTGKDISGR